MPSNLLSSPNSSRALTPPTSPSSSRRWTSPLALILCSFTAGAVFGGSIVKFHGESVDLTISRVTLSFQEEIAISSSADISKDEDACRCEEENIAELCEGNNYVLRLIPPKSKSNGSQITADQRSLINDSDKPDAKKKLIRASKKKLIRASKKKLIPVQPAFDKLSRKRGDLSDQFEDLPPSRQFSIYKQMHRKHPSKLKGPIEQWCPTARCRVSDLCHPCKRRFLILITTARSASTTLTWMLGALPGVRMSGENANTLGYLKRLMDNILENPHWQEATGQRAAWGHQYVPAQSLSCVSQAMIEGINPPPLKLDKIQIKHVNASKTDIVGFKTIRFLHDAKTQDDETNMILWLRSNFPCSRVVVNINSNVTQQTESIIKAFRNKSNPTEESRLLEQNQQLKKVVKTLGPKQAFLLDKNEWTHNISKLNEVVTWLGFHPSCQFTELMEFNTRGKGYGNTKTTLAKFNSTCVRLD